MVTNITVRPSNNRGNAERDWLKAFYSFTLDSLSDPEHERFGCIRIINEDRFEANNGFGMHSHREFEIFTYVVSGKLDHADSMGNIEHLKRGDVQMTSGGTGIQHSEKAGSESVHLLQIWAFPWQGNLTPHYYTRHFTDEEKKDKWVRVVAPLGDPGVTEDRDASTGPAPIHSHLTMYATLQSPSTKKLSHMIPTGKAYILLPQISGYNPGKSTGAHVRLSSSGAEVDLREGDAAYIVGDPSALIQTENVGNQVAEMVLFVVE